MAELDCRIPTIVVDDVYEELEYRDRREWTLPSGVADRSVVLLTRDPRDAAISNFFQKRYRHPLQFESESRVQCDAFKQLNSPVFKWREEPFCETTEPAPKNCSCFPVDYTVKQFVREPVSNHTTLTPPSRSNELHSSVDSKLLYTTMRFSLSNATTCDKCTLFATKI